MPTTSTKPKAQIEDSRGTTSENEVPAEKSASGLHFVLYGLTILLSAFLLFQVELIMAKFLLPRFGGGPSVWSTSLLVFQILLLGGYAYAAAISARLPARVQGLTHLTLLALSAVVMSAAWARVHSPIFPGSSLALRGGEDPVWPIIFLLLSSVGVQCVLLSATSPLLQHWFSRQHQRSPYRLYALSNLGSMVGLLAYPLLVERVMTLTRQAWFWSAGYFGFALLAGTVALLSMHTTPVIAAQPRLVKARKVKKAEAHPKILWLALAACSCIMLLATTNLICQQIAPIPLLWVLPLSLYLLSFIICFDHARWYRRGFFHPFFLVWALLALRLLPNYTALPTSGLLVVYSIALFAVCMVCHGELARLKPSAEGLTSFYLLVSAGGVIGSAFVALLAPQIFDRFWEFQIGLVGCAVLLGVSLFRDRSSWIYTVKHGRAIFAGAALLMVLGTYYFTRQIVSPEGTDETYVSRSRNFFGIKEVVNTENGLELRHGHTTHGFQNTTPEERDEPTAYYSRESGIGLLLDHYPRSSGRPLRVGVIGMGVGTLAAYGKTGDHYRYYEIDPAVAAYSSGAQPTFTFVKDSPAKVDVVIGDARIKLQEEASAGQLQDFDILVVDAFSGDTIPVHLLTRQAMNLYLRHLHSPASVIAFHVSSSTLDLRPVIQSLANSYGMANIEVNTAGTTTFGSIWVLLSRDPTALRIPDLGDDAHSLEVTTQVRTWTDDYSSLYDVLHW